MVLPHRAPEAPPAQPVPCLHDGARWNRGADLQECALCHAVLPTTSPGPCSHAAIVWDDEEKLARCRGCGLALRPVP